MFVHIRLIQLRRFAPPPLCSGFWICELGVCSKCVAEDEAECLAAAVSAGIAEGLPGAGPDEPEATAATTAKSGSAGWARRATKS